MNFYLFHLLLWLGDLFQLDLRFLNQLLDLLFLFSIIKLHHFIWTILFLDLFLLHLDSFDSLYLILEISELLLLLGDLCP